MTKQPEHRVHLLHIINTWAVWVTKSSLINSSDYTAWFYLHTVLPFPQSASLSISYISCYAACSLYFNRIRQKQILHIEMFTNHTDLVLAGAPVTLLWMKPAGLGLMCSGAALSQSLSYKIFETSYNKKTIVWQNARKQRQTSLSNFTLKQ